VGNSDPPRDSVGSHTGLESDSFSVRKTAIGSRVVDGYDDEPAAERIGPVS
jgi:hypothetical protein